MSNASAMQISTRQLPVLNPTNGCTQVTAAPVLARDRGPSGGSSTIPKLKPAALHPARATRSALRETLIKSGFEGDGLQAVRKSRKIIAASAAEGPRRPLIRAS